MTAGGRDRSPVHDYFQILGVAPDAGAVNDVSQGRLLPSPNEAFWSKL